MCELKVITIQESQKWDNIVRSFREYDVYYLSGYAKAFQLHGDGEPLLFYFENESMKAINVAMKRDIAKDMHFINKLPEDTYYDLATPYGYGGFLVEGNIEYIAELDSVYSSYCRKNSIISEFVRFHPLLNNQHPIKDIYEVKDLGKTISIDLESKSLIWDNFTCQKRNKVRKACKSGIRVFCGRNKELFRQFMEMYNNTMDRDNAKPYYYFKEPFYDSLLNDLSYNLLVFYATYGCEIVAMSIVIFSNKRMHYHLSASKSQYMSLSPSCLLLYEAACWGSENGFISLHLGGGLGSREDGLYKFKSSFNRNSNNTFSIGKKIFNQEIYDDLIKQRKKENSFDESVDYFPKYRG